MDAPPNAAVVVMVGVAAVTGGGVVVVVPDDAPPPPPHPHMTAPDNAKTANIFEPARISPVSPFRRKINLLNRRTPSKHP
jgi:hypothetical protein